MNTMNKMAAILALGVLGAGCSDFLQGPGLTESPNNPTQATAVQQLISVQSSMATRLEGQIARCAGIFTQQLIGSNNQQLTQCTQYAMTESDISGAMSGFYTGGGLLGLRNIQDAATKLSDNFMLGEAKIWEGLSMGTATSVWGDLPYSEAATPTITEPKLDRQEDIYAAVQKRLDEGIAAMQAAAAGASGNCVPGDGDLIYCASAVARATEIARWIKAAYTLKARFYLHLVEQHGPGEYANVLAAALQGIDEAPTSTTQAVHGQAPGDFRFFHGSVQDFDANIWAEFLQQRQDVVAGNVFIQMLKARNDSIRLRSYFDANAGGLFIGSDQNNNPVPAAAVPSVINTSVRRQFTFRQPIVTWVENQLILAEAKFRTGDPAGAAVHVDTVRALVGLTKLGTYTFAEIMTEKYIAMFQNIDVWSDYKRACVPTLVPFGAPPKSEVMGRLPYGSAERNANPHIPLPSAYPALTSGPSAFRNWNDPNPC